MSIEVAGSAIRLWLVDWDPTSEAVWKVAKDTNLGRSPDRKQPWNPLPHLVDRKREPVRSLHVHEHLLLWPPQHACLKYQRQCGVFGQQVHEGFLKPDPLINPRCSRNTLTIDNGLWGTLATVIIRSDPTAQTLMSFGPEPIFTPIAQIGLHRWPRREISSFTALHDHIEHGVENLPHIYISGSFTGFSWWDERFD